MANARWSKRAMLGRYKAFDPGPATGTPVSTLSGLKNSHWRHDAEPKMLAAGRPWLLSAGCALLGITAWGSVRRAGIPDEIFAGTKNCKWPGRDGARRGEGAG